MDERDAQPATELHAVPALVEAQLEAAREKVFAAYVKARANGRDLGFDDADAPTHAADRQRRAS